MSRCRSERRPGRRVSGIGLVVSDVDGTLANDDKELSDGNEAAVKSLIAGGTPVALISARPPSGLGWIMERLGIDGPCCAFNGGTVFDAAGTVGTPHRLEGDLASRLITTIKGADILCWAFADGDWLADGQDDVHTAREVRSAGVQPIVTDTLDSRLGRIDKLVAVCDDAERLGRLEEQVQRLADGRAHVVLSQPYYLDITAPEANKGDGLEALARAYGVPTDRIAVLGDQNNDLPMFARAGLSIAMGQASAHVRERADQVATTNNQDGVADAIERFIRPRLG